MTCILQYQNLVRAWRKERESSFMINNTSLQRWQRATARHLDTQFMNAIIAGMNCSTFEAEAIRDQVHTVYSPLMETTDALKPGQLRLSVIAASVAPNIALAHAHQCLITITMDAGESDRVIRQRGGIIALRRARMLRICEEAFQQGGLFTLEAIADLFNCAVRTLVSDLAAIRATGIIPPLRSTVKDMGRAITHRRVIVEKWLAGSEYSDIARMTAHSVSSVANYIEKYKRVAALLQTEFDEATIALIARLSPALVRAFTQLVADAHPVPHRREELDALAKKKTASSFPSHPEGVQ
jgi:hypothetical protein